MQALKSKLLLITSGVTDLLASQCYFILFVLFLVTLYLALSQQKIQGII